MDIKKLETWLIENCPDKKDLKVKISTDFSLVLLIICFNKENDEQEFRQAFSLSFKESQDINSLELRSKIKNTLDDYDYEEAIRGAR